MGLCLSQIFQYTVHQRSNNNHEDGLTDQDLGILPIIASPVVPEAKRWLDRQRQRQPHASEVTGVRRRSTVTQFEAEHTVAQLAGRIFHKQHAASSLELFFDLFFVANLAVFTDQHALVDGQCKSSWTVKSISLIQGSNRKLHRILLHTVDHMVSCQYLRCSLLH